MSLFVLPRQIIVDVDGVPRIAAELYFYQSGTTTPITVYTTSSYAVNHPNPVESEGDGFFPAIYINPAVNATYKVVVKDSLGATIWTEDDVPALGFTASDLGSVLYPRTAAEVAAAVTPVNYSKAPGNVLRYGTNTTPGTTDMTAAIQAAHDQGDEEGGARPFLPSGDALISTSIRPCVLGMCGEGPKRSRLICDGVNAFEIPSNAGWDRPQVIFENFGIESNDGTSCDDKWAFYVPGVATGAAVAYNSGLIIRDLAIGRTARMGGGFYLKDVFEARIYNISITDAQRVAQIVGSVAQSSFRDISALAGDAGAGSGLAGGSIGLSTESASYASGTLTPEHITTHDVSLIVFDVGVQHTSGLDCNFYNTDVQARVTGMSINAHADVKGAIIIPHTTGVTAWAGVVCGVNPGVKEGRYLSNIEVSMGNMPGTPASSYGFDMGDGVSPCYGVVMKECTVRGLASSLQTLVRGRINKDFTMHDCRLEAAVALSTEISLSSAQRLDIRNTHCPSGILAIGDGGDSTAYGSIQLNEVGTLTLSPLTSPQNWNIGPNEGLTPVRSAYETGAFTATLTGCTTSPTGSVKWLKNGQVVTITFPVIQGTSNTTACTLTGLPAEITPANQQDCLGRATDNGANGVCGYRFPTSGGVISMFFGASLGSWTGSGTKGSSACTFSYSLA